MSLQDSSNNAQEVRVSIGVNRRGKCTIVRIYKIEDPFLIIPKNFLNFRLDTIEKQVI